MFSLLLGKKFLEKLIFYLIIIIILIFSFRYANNGYMKKISPQLFFISVFDPCICKGDFVDHYF